MSIWGACTVLGVFLFEVVLFLFCFVSLSLVIVSFARPIPPLFSIFFVVFLLFTYVSFFRLRSTLFYCAIIFAVCTDAFTGFVRTHSLVYDIEYFTSSPETRKDF